MQIDLINGIRKGMLAFFVLLVSCSQWGDSQLEVKSASMQMLLRTPVSANPGDSIRVRIIEDGQFKMDLHFAASESPSLEVALSWFSQIQVSVRYIVSSDTLLMADTSFIMPQQEDVSLLLTLNAIEGGSSSSSSNSSSSSYSSSSVSISSSSVIIDTVAKILTDVRDGRTYRYVTLFSRNWMAQNLDYKGEANLGHCYDFAKDSDPSGCGEQGRFYRWKELMNDETGSDLVPSRVQGICPEGWLVPSWKDWIALRDSIESQYGVLQSLVGSYLKALPSGQLWDWQTDSMIASVPLGLDIIASGYITRTATSGAEMGKSAYFHSTSNTNLGPYHFIFRDSTTQMGLLWTADSNYFGSVRCVQDSGASQIFVDSRDGEKYPFVSIGSQVWLAKNMEWVPSSGSYCKNNSLDWCREFGRLYDLNVVDQVCPSGWRLPDSSDFNTLENFAKNQGLTVAHLRGRSGWTDAIFSENIGGFSARGAGFMVGGALSQAGEVSQYWTNTPASNGMDRIGYGIRNNSAYTVQSYSTGTQLGIRCIKDTL